MCSRGTYQLRKLSLFFCDWGGSSQGIRSLLASNDLQSFQQQHPHIDFEVILKRNHHPYFLARWINGYIRDVPIRSYSKEEILEQFEHCNNTFGKSSVQATGKRVTGVRESIQGKWSPNMWGTYPRAEMENAHIIQEPKIPLIEKPLSQPKKKIRGYEYQDQLTRSLKKNLYRGP